MLNIQLNVAIIVQLTAGQLTDAVVGKMIQKRSAPLQSLCVKYFSHLTDLHSLSIIPFIPRFQTSYAFSRLCVY
jgi:hypothetical protein